MPETLYSICGMCAVRCPVEATVEAGRMTWVQGNTHDAGMGSAMCAKGVATSGLRKDEDRPRQPLIREGARGEGKWRPVSWEEALDHVAARLTKVTDRLGGRGVLLSDRGGPFGELRKGFLKALGSPNYFNHDCTCARNVHHAALSMFGFGRKGVTYDLKNSRHIVLWGRNIVEALNVKEARQFMAALKKGARLTYIDPRASITASKATRFLQIRPGTDHILNLALIHVLLDEEIYDRKFVDRWVEGLGRLREFIRGKTPEWAQEHTGIPADTIRAVARELADDAPNVLLHPGWMMARGRNFFSVSRTIYILSALLGSFEVPGGLMFTKGPGDVGRKGLAPLLPDLPAVDEKRVDGAGWKYPHIDKGPGLLHLLYPALESGEPYEVGAYICHRHDPLLSLPDPEAQKKLLDKLDLIVSIDINYSETAWYSDVILPECTWTERGDLLAVKKGPSPAIIMRQPLEEPRFDTRPNWWIFTQLARRLGHGEHFPFESLEDIWTRQLSGTGISIDAIREKGFYSLGKAPLFDRDDGLKFKTPSGKIEFFSSRLEEHGYPSFSEPVEPEQPPPGQFRMLFGRAAVHNHGHTMNNPLLHEQCPDNPVWLHPGPAAELGIADGDAIELRRNGTTATGTVHVTEAIHPEAIFLLHGFGRGVPAQKRAYRRGIADYRLQTGKLDDWDPVGGGVALTECFVEVRKAGANR